MNKIAQAAKIVERMVNQNTYDEIAQGAPPHQCTAASLEYCIRAYRVKYSACRLQVLRGRERRAPRRGGHSAAALEVLLRQGQEARRHRAFLVAHLHGPVRRRPRLLYAAPAQCSSPTRHDAQWERTQMLWHSPRVQMSSSSPPTAWCSCARWRTRATRSISTRPRTASWACSSTRRVLSCSASASTTATSALSTCSNGGSLCLYACASCQCQWLFLSWLSKTIINIKLRVWVNNTNFRVPLWNWTSVEYQENIWNLNSYIATMQKILSRKNN